MVKRKKIQGGFLGLLHPKLKELIITGIIGAIALIGIIFRDELTMVIKENLFYGTVEIIVDNQEIKKHSKVVILDGKQESIRSFFLKDQSSIRLSSGNYGIQIFYPKVDGSKEEIFEEAFELKRREHKRIYPVLKLPNMISVKLETPKEKFIPEEQISFIINSDRDGYLWLFSPDSSGNPNQFFPKKSDLDNRIEAGKRYAVPPYQKGSFTLKTISTPGEETIVCIVTEFKDQQFAFHCLKKVVPYVSLKIAVTKEALWGYDKKIVKVE